jgi:radical SAM superfamily enzyme YgiQ (UPF0313 family)
MDKPFRPRDYERVLADLDEAAREMPGATRAFIMDGDALALPRGKFKQLLADIRERLPEVRRVSTYANAFNISKYSPEELAELKDHGLSMLYVGLESGDEQTLAAVNKGASAAEIVDECKKAKAAGLKLNVTVLLGLGGKKRSLEHARATASALNEMAPQQAAALTLTLIPGTPLHEAAKAGEFRLPDKHGLLAELREMIAGLDYRGLFLADHASNYLPLKLRLPADKDKALSAIDAALSGRKGLKPEWLRGL